MEWTTILLLIAFIIYLIYNGVAIKLFGIPESLSNTFYLYKDKKDWLKVLFPIMMLSIVVFLLPSWLTISEGSNLQFLSFLAVGGILFTGAAPMFKNKGIESRVHTISAICAAVFSILWVVFVAKLLLLLIVWFLIVALLSISTGTYKKCLIYWLETVAFMSSFNAIIMHSII